ncbi:MAG TPA: ester cyclase [Thermoanaerobaculia bacterium]|nr:ester cyclase [Thermoanaerobaculia bacterium]
MRGSRPAVRSAAAIAAMAAVLVTVLAPRAFAAPAATEATGAGGAAAAADHRQQNKVLARRYLTEVLAAGKLDKLDEIVASSFVDRSPNAAGSLRGPDAARQAQKRLRELFSKVEYSPQALIAEGDQVAARYVVLATLKPERGAPAPPPLLLNGIALFLVRAGRIQEVFILNDQLGLLRQLGYTLVPPGGGGAATPAPSAPDSRISKPPSPGSPPPGSSPPSPPPASPPASPPPGQVR